MRPSPRLLACLAGLALAGCVQTGDFGRVTPSVWNDAVAATGTVAAAARGEPVSLNALTDDETELRERAWRFLVPSRGRPWLDRILAELVATRVLPADLVEPNPHAYLDGLLSTEARSPVSRYRRLSEDAGADAVLVTPFVLVAARVLRADRVRLRTLSQVADRAAFDPAGALARVAENRCLVAWVTSATVFRLSAYRIALDGLVIESPEPDVGPTGRALARLATERRHLDALGVPPLAAAACLGPVAAPVLVAPDVFAPAPSAVPLVRKG